MENKENNLVKLYEQAINQNPEVRALSDYGGNSYTYRKVGERIRSLHKVFKACKIGEGDKIALVGKNSSHWGMIYLATITYGAVIVPILPDFKPEDIHSLVNHSDSLLLFVGDSLYKNMDAGEMKDLKSIIQIQDFSVLHLNDESLKEPLANALQVREGETEKDGSIVSFKDIASDNLAVISYTSGTTGFSKGVMLNHKSLLGNMLFAQDKMPLKAGDKIVSFLPLAHAYGCAFEFLFPFSLGCDINFLTKTPTPQIVTQAFQEIKPSLILSVPLVIEKIYKKRLLPTLKKGSVRFLIRIPGINKLIYKKIKTGLIQAFGGNFNELIIGGAAFNDDAERLFRKINFPYTVGYGMTECGPLISYASWNTTKFGASGRPVDELELKIDSEDPYSKIGEIMVRGSHVMLGYYKNEEATKKVLDAEGWLHTGDLGVIDKDQNLFIKGRSKSMILGASGQNIFPEELESILNNRSMILETLVVDRERKLVALICPDADAVKKMGINEDRLKKIFQRYIDDLNERFPPYMYVSGFEIHPEEFTKTPKRSIKRFMYT